MPKRLLPYLCMLSMVPLFAACGDPDAVDSPVLETCRTWENDSRLITASGTLSIEIDGVMVPATDEWNVGIDPVIRHDGHDIGISACVPDSHYFEEIDGHTWWDEWTFEATWNLAGDVPQGEPVQVPAARVGRPAVFGGLSEREETECGPFTDPQTGAHKVGCQLEVKRHWLATSNGVGEMQVDFWDPLERRFVASGWMRAGDHGSQADDLRIEVDLRW